MCRTLVRASVLVLLTTTAALAEEPAPPDPPGPAEPRSGEPTSPDATDPLAELRFELVTVGPWTALPRSFRTRVTAAADLDADAALFFDKGRAIAHTTTATDAPNSGLMQFPFDVDAALPWSATQLLLFAGDMTYLFDVENEGMIERPLRELGLPERWDRVDAAANFDETHWVLFRRGEALFYRFPSGETPPKVESVVKLSDWWGRWDKGIDAAMTLPDGRLAVFRGRKFMMIDAKQGFITEPMPYALRSDD